MFHEAKRNNFAYLILGYKSDDMTLDLVKRIREFDFKSTIVVVDNSVENKPLEAKLSSLRNTHFISSGANLGYARGNNVGLRYLSQKGDVDFVFICNPDIEIDKISIALMKEAICKHQSVAILGSRILDTQANDQVSHWVSKTLVQDIMGDFSSLRFLLHNFKKPINTDLQPVFVECDVVTGAFFLADLDVLRNVSYFDERTFLYCEERILAKRLDKVGAKRFVLTAATCQHRGSSTISVKFATRLKRHLLLIASRRVYYRYYSSPVKLFIYSLSTPFSIFEKVLLDAFISVFGIFKR
ncbi:glycosyltransferase family 2 protein [Pseudomonadales bacterium]|nr:glycosyltransferase family 2 protein [Pseudomonadales bacterium]